MKHKNLMILGTASSVGKSLITAGLCRIINNDGFSVAPFKSQNMALNSFVTKDGKEMGRAQVVQAEASRIDPEVYMNPILLKPTSDKKSQIIVNGKVLKNMDAKNYFQFKYQLKPEILKAYRYILENFEYSIIEGAGSPAEINLNENDIVNMGMAEMADAPVILVSDIDRGGVFASIFGTIKLLPENQQNRIKAVIINKFRGDVDILKPGLKMIEDLTGIPVIGVLPYSDINIEDEDSLTDSFNSNKNMGDIKISVIKLNRLSNFTDIDPLKAFDNISINFVTKASQIGDEDLIIIPGSKNTVEDLKILKDNGIADKIIRESRKGKLIFGICGGFQMLGDKIIDLFNIESSIKEIGGLGLLDMQTTMEKEKKTTQFLGTIDTNSELLKDINGIKIKGYEIHQGVSKSDEKSFIKNDEVLSLYKNRVFGTYIHGIFDNKEFTEHLINSLRKEKGLNSVSNDFSFEDYKDLQYEKLDRLMREHIDIDKIYKIMNGEKIEFYS